MTTPLASAVRDAVASVTGPGPVFLHEPWFGGREHEYLRECIDSTFVSSVGKFVDRFEEELAAFTGIGHAVAASTGTAALHAALHLAGVRRDDEVLIPSLSFVATANAVVYCGAVPHFVDVEETTLGMDPEALRAHLEDGFEVRDGLCVNVSTGRTVRAVVPMHTFGHLVDVEELLAVADDFRLELVEDAAEALGSRKGEKHAGSFGRMGILSFNGNKTITTGGGGAILTEDEALAAEAKHVTTTAKVPHPWHYAHDRVGFNYRLPNLNAALGCAQLEQLPKLLEAKRRLHEQYVEAFRNVEGARMVSEPPDTTSNYWLQALLLDEGAPGSLEEVLAVTNEAGLMTRPAWTPLHTLPHFADAPRAPLPVTESLAARLVNLPSSAQLAF